MTAAVVVPWLAAWPLVPDRRIDWQCLSDIEFDTVTPHGKFVQVTGTMASDYSHNGTGTARFSGRIRQVDTVNVVHRMAEFDYVALDSMVRVNTIRASRLATDDAPDDLVFQYVYGGFRPGHTDYFQAMRTGAGMSVGFNQQPRVFCAAPPGARAAGAR
ncbi:hypothetical protein AB870_04620 [Pandoraea faecigallinarum]|uniref:Uncharacterized protein n=1 Tax=Pandoraea faecigallinarum TaxID=656179 RepID=A0A0H3WSL8_9BURK|nr:hypothetical protein AB870_04620 [Pandoraea faecigallinarum]